MSSTVSCDATATPSQDVTVYGARYSVYTRIVRLALEEKAIAYHLNEVDIFAPDGPPAAYAERHPFMRIPAFEHAGFRLYETTAITRYIDEAWSGPPLHPADPQRRARMNQAISIMDAYAFRSLVWDVYVERVRVAAPDEDKIRTALARAKTILRALLVIKAGSPWMTGPDLTLADLYVAPMLILFRLAPEGAKLMAEHPELADWLDRFKARPSAQRTWFPVEPGNTPELDRQFD